MSARNSNSKKGGEERSLLRQSLDSSLIAFALLAVSCGIAIYWFKGEDTLRQSLVEGWELLKFILPRVGAAVLIAAFLQLLVPREVVSRLIGDKAGLRSVVIATIAGMFTPGGPLTCFPIVIALFTAGANKGALVAYLSAWAMIGVQRSLVWELPLMGPEFTAIRVGASLILPIIAGTVALYLPFRIKLPRPPEV